MSTVEDEPPEEPEAEPEPDDDEPPESPTETPKPQQPQEKSAEKIADVINFFQNQSRDGRTGGPSNRPRHGPLHDTEIDAELRYYCRPDCYDEAAERLGAERVIVICGPAGLGKRAAGINLLREHTHSRLMVVSAAADLKELAANHYRCGYGYLIVSSSGGLNPSDADFAWQAVRSRVRGANAYLVVTTAAEVSVSVDAVAQIAWERPNLRRVLRGYLAAQDLDDDAVDALAARCGEECSMTDLTAVARKMAAGAGADEALEKLGETSARRVQEWFDGPREIAEILDVTALAFLDGATYRRFDSWRRSLENAMRRHKAIEAAGRNRRKDAADALPARRLQRLREEGLITDRVVSGAVGDRRVLTFKRPEYRRHVLTEIYQRWEVSFWNALADWLTALIDHGPDTQVAEGLALLAAVDFEEVELAYLDRWSKGLIGPNGQTTAVFVLWWMCFAEDTMPIALKVAKRWANHGDPEQRWAAAMVYSGELGACDPVQAIRQLWHLIVQSSKGFEQACFAMAALFHTLIGATEDAGKVLSTLEHQVNRPLTRPQDGEVVRRARHTLAQLLVLREPRLGVPVTFVYLKKYPDRIDVVVRLWTTSIRHSMYRKMLLEALWNALGRLAQISDKPLELAQSLGEAFVAAMSPAEVDDFYQHLRLIDARKRVRGKPGESLARVVLDVVKRFYRRKAG